jgi:hypothetical protein
LLPFSQQDRHRLNEGNRLRTDRWSKHSPDGLRPHREPDGLIPAPIDRDDTGPHSLEHHTGNSSGAIRFKVGCQRLNASANSSKVTASRLTMPRTQPSAPSHPWMETLRHHREPRRWWSIRLRAAMRQERNSIGERWVENFTA